MLRVRLEHVLRCTLMAVMLTAAGAAAAQKVTDPDPLIQQAVELYQDGKYDEALPAAKRALEATEKARGPWHPSVGTCLNNLGQIHRAQGRLVEAEPAIKRALAIFVRTLGTDHPAVATAFVNLAEVYKAQSRLDEAEALLKRAQAIREKLLAAPGAPQAAAPRGPSVSQAAGVPQAPPAKAAVRGPSVSQAAAAPRGPIVSQARGLPHAALPQAAVPPPPVAIIAFLAAVAAAIPLSLVLLWGYRRAIARAMTRGAGRRLRLPGASWSSPLPPTRESPANRVPLTLIRSDGRAIGAMSGDARTIYAAARSRPWIAAIVYTAAGLVFAAAATASFFSIGEMQAVPRLTLLLACGFLWPAVFAASTVLTSNWRRRLIIPALYFIGLGGLVYWAAPKFDPLLVLATGVPLAAWALTASKWLRTAAPFVLFALLCGAAAFLFTFLGGYAYFARTGVIPRTPAAYYGALVFMTAAGLLTGLLLLWLFARLYRAKLWSDELLLATVRMLLVTAWLAALTVSVVQPLGTRLPPVAVVLAAFAGFVITAYVLFRLFRRDARNVRLMLVRVFAPAEGADKMLAMLGHYWRHIGSIQLIGAPDAMTNALEPSKLMDFLNARLRRHFIADAFELDAHLAGIDFGRDPDGRYRINDFYCQGDAWQATVSRLIRYSDAILVDLRGFSFANRGVSFELQFLLDRVPAGRMVLAIDETTDTTELREALEYIWRLVPPESPNRGRPGAIAVVNVGARNGARGVRYLLRALCNAARPAHVAAERGNRVRRRAA